MNTLKTFLFNRFNILFPLFVLTTFSLFLLTFRLKIADTFFYLFLAWNLFLAMVPFFISVYAKATKPFKKYKFIALLVVWLLFLPNAPYIITDFIHIRLSPAEWIVFDILMISIFAITGLACYLFSVKDISEMLFKNFNKRIVSIFIIFLPFLVSFGVYLGRFLRWNSWDILHNPLNLFMDVFKIFTNPINNFEAWVFTILFGLFLKFGQWFFDKYLFGYIKS